MERSLPTKQTQKTHAKHYVVKNKVRQYKYVTVKYKTTRVNWTEQQGF